MSFRASSFVDNEGGPPRTGQFFIAIDPDCFSDPDFGDRFEALIAAMLEQDGTRLPGDRRLLSREWRRSSFARTNFGDRFEALIAAMLEQDGTGDRRLLSRERTARDGVTIGKALYERIMGYCD